MDFNAIDWNALWQAESGRSNRDRVLQKDIWDKRAAGFCRRVNRPADGREALDPEDYIFQMLERIKTRSDWTLLDIGSGPGTLAIPLAKSVRSVTALDFSSEMLSHLKIRADESGLHNIRCINTSWQDAFSQGLADEHDVVVASRSLMSGDMKEAISHINSLARQAVYLTIPIIHLPFDHEVYRAVGRHSLRHPPYIYFYNLLYQMGIQANVEILRSRIKVRFSSVEEAIDDLQWRTEPFTTEERSRIREYLDGRFAEQKDSPFFTHDSYSRWALIWWRKADQF